MSPLYIMRQPWSSVGFGLLYIRKHYATFASEHVALWETTMGEQNERGASMMVASLCESLYSNQIHQIQ